MVKKRYRDGLSFLFIVLFLFYVIFPILLVVAGSFGKRWYGTLLPEFFTLKWYSTLFSTRQYVNAMSISLMVATVTVITSFVVTLPAVYAVQTYGAKRLKSIFETLVILPVAVPPLVMAVGLIELYTFKNVTFVGTVYIVIAAHIIFTLPFMLKPLMASFEIINWKALNEAADSLGADAFHKTTAILLPNIFPGLISGGLMVFAMSLGEFQLALMLSGFRTQTYPVLLQQAFYQQTGFACAATTLLIFVAFVSLSLMARLVKKLGGNGRKGNPVYRVGENA